MTETSIAPRAGIRFATDRRGGPVEWQLEGPEPHMILTGGTGMGTSSTARVIASSAALLDIDVRFCDAKPCGASELQGLPGITAAAGLPETAGLIGRTWADMCQRGVRAEAGAVSAGSLRRIVLIIDHFMILDLDLNDVCRGERPSPVMRQLGQLLFMSQAAAINVLLTGMACHVALVLGDQALEKCGTRVALGQVGREAAMLLFGDDSAYGESRGRTQGAGVVLTPAGGPEPAAMLYPPPARPSFPAA